MPVVIKVINTLLTVLAGIGVALAVFWLLNKLAEVLLAIFNSNEAN